MSLKEKLEKTEENGLIKKTGKRTVPDVVPVASSVTRTIKKKDVNIPAGSTDPKQAKWEPKHWKEVLESLRMMRKAKPAPVDTMGCHMCSDDEAGPEEKRFHILVALMLSSQTKDEVGLGEWTDLCQDSTNYTLSR